MQGRIVIEFEVQGTPHTFDKEFKAPVYLDVLLKGRERVRAHTKGLTKFHYKIQFRNRRMEWQSMEYGDELTLYPERATPRAEH
jgi:hypothetical protein